MDQATLYSMTDEELYEYCKKTGSDEAYKVRNYRYFGDIPRKPSPYSSEINYHGGSNYDDQQFLGF